MSLSSLHGTGVGKKVVDELNKRIDNIYDSRNWKEGMTPESAELAANELREMVKSIEISREKKETAQTSFE